jgi:RNA polymerase sigma-70 factor (ECF subfamily)
MEKADENPEDRDLHLAAQGDKQAFGRLYSRYLNEIYRFVYFKVGHEPIAEDITEETFIRTWTHLSGIYTNNGRIANLRAWLYRTANNLVIDYYRQKKPVESHDRQVSDDLPQIEAIAVEHEQLKILTNAIKELEPDDQQIIILRLVNELSHKEAAHIMKISEGSSRILLYRALKKLKRILNQKEAKHA